MVGHPRGKMLGHDLVDVGGAGYLDKIGCLCHIHAIK